MTYGNFGNRLDKVSFGRSKRPSRPEPEDDPEIDELIYSEKQNIKELAREAGFTPQDVKEYAMECNYTGRSGKRKQLDGLMCISERMEEDLD